MAEIVKGLEKMEQLVTDFIKRATTLLDVSRADDDRWLVSKDSVDVCEVVSAVAERYQMPAKHAGASLKVEAPPTGHVLALGDRGALEQVLENLVSNALKYGGGSPIRIAADAHPERRVAEVVVQDGGPGIPDEDHARIFDRYERAVAVGTEISGYGIGLWVVRNLCDAMGGAIQVVSNPGGGAIFCVSLPLLDDAKRA